MPGPRRWLVTKLDQPRRPRGARADPEHAAEPFRGELIRLPDPHAQPAVRRYPDGLCRQPARRLARGGHVHQVPGERHRPGDRARLVHRRHLAVAGPDQHADLARRFTLPGALTGFWSGGERELVGTQQQAFREGPYCLGRLLPGGRGEHATARGKTAAEGGSRLAHILPGSVAEAEEHDTPRRAVHMRHGRGDVPGLAGRLAGSQHVGGGAA